MQLALGPEPQLGSHSHDEAQACCSSLLSGIAPSTLVLEHYPRSLMEVNQVQISPSLKLWGRHMLQGRLTLIFLSLLVHLGVGWGG